jgi:RNA polymerase sigma-70 factor (ECF subfamily)
LLDDERRQFEQTLLPHMASVYNLARWLMRDEQEAEDVVQEAYVRALKAFGGFHGSDGRAWLLTITRHTCYTRLRQLRGHGVPAAFDEQIHGVSGDCTSPEAALVQKEECQSLQQALEALPVEFREVVVLRELEGLSYKEIAAIAEISMGTVMSRLSRGRALLRRSVDERMTKDG